MPASKVSYSHYSWAFGHVLVLLGTFYTLFRATTFRPESKSYYISYSGAIISWGIVVYKSLGVPQLNRAYIQRALLDENVQYLLLALYWYLQKPIYVTLIPFATFSLFHSLTFVRTNFLSKTPSTSSSGGTKAAAPTTLTGGQKLSKQIQAWVKAHYEQAMLFVSFVEVVVVFGRVLFGALLFRNSFLAPLFFAHFLRLRYYLSQPTRQAFSWVSAQVDHLTSNPNCPAPVKNGIVMVRQMIIRYSESVVAVPGQGPQPAAAGAGAAAAGGAGARGARPGTAH